MEIAQVVCTAAAGENWTVWNHMPTIAAIAACVLYIASIVARS
jgi:uncharacterized membrane protein